MPKVAISYGHGANTWEDKRSKGVIVNGIAYEEHNFNAVVGQKVTLILRDHGVQVLEVQPAYGLDVSLTTRINTANNWGADIYWSIHANAGAPEARGLCGFWWQGSPEGKRLAELYAKYSKLENFPVYSGDYMWESIDGTWAAFQELKYTKMPALLTENGFMTNAEDFKMIFQNKDNYWNRLAYTHVKAILEYFGIEYDPIKSGEVKPVELIGFNTGGYSGEGLSKVHEFISVRKWYFEPRRNADNGSITFYVGTFHKGSEQALAFENFLKTNGYWYEIINISA